MKKVFVLLIFAVFAIISACTSLKRHARAEFKADDDSLADIELFGYNLYDPSDISAPGNLWDLNATAQANLLEIIDRRFNDNESFIRALNNRYNIDNSKSVNHGYIRKNLQLVFSVSRKRDYRSVGKSNYGGHPAADRLEYLELSLELPDSIDMKFTGWNRFKTEYAELKIADVSFNSSLDLTADAGITENDNIERTAKAGLKGSVSQKEDQALKHRYLKMNGSLADKKISIEEEGTREIDLTGNIIADVSLEFGSFTEKVFLPEYSTDKEDNIILTDIRSIDIPVPFLTHAVGPVIAKLSMDFVYRHVAAGSETFQEWDDIVEYYSGTVNKDVTLLDVEDYLPSFQCIGLQYPKKEILRVRTGDGESYALKFVDYNSAQKFLEYLRYDLNEESKNMIYSGDFSFYLDNEPLSPDSSIEELMVLPYYDL